MATKKKFTPAPPKPKKPRAALSPLDKVTMREITKCAEHVHTKVEKLDKPELKFPDRSLKNARYDMMMTAFGGVGSASELLAKGPCA